MEHIAIDLGSKHSQVCVRDSTGAITEEARRSTAELGRWLASRAPARVVLETCTEAFRLAGVAQRHGHEVRVVAATLGGGALHEHLLRHRAPALLSARRRGPLIAFIWSRQTHVNRRCDRSSSGRRFKGSRACRYGTSTTAISSTIGTPWPALARVSRPSMPSPARFSSNIPFTSRGLAAARS